MRLRKEQSGFVLSGVALLLVLPAMLLVASLFTMVKIGGETTSLQVVADKVFYTGYDTERMVKYMENRGLPINNETLGQLAENYQASTGLLVNIGPVVVYPIWVHVNDTGVDHFAGTKYCRVTEISPGIWEYNFEDLDEGLGQSPDWDYNEPRLQVEKLDGSIKVTVLGYEGGYSSMVYYSENLLFAQVGPNDFGVGSTAIVENAIERGVPIFLTDPRGTAQYSTNVPLK